jgi:thioredoxin reductase (NADPH)
MSVPAHSIIDSRRHQMFPSLATAEIERMRRFGVLRSYGAGQALVKVGEVGPGLTIILAGEVQITQRDQSGRRNPIVTHGPGAFMGELAQLSGRPVLVDAYAQGPVEALIIAPERLRALLVAEAEMGERIMRALILRRVGLIEAGAGGPVIVGHAESGDVLQLQGFLSRHGHPQQTLNPDTDAEAKALMLRYPGEDDLARCIGLVGPIDSDRVYDVVIVGAGQAGASARIENYMGFPTGITGMALMARAYNHPGRSHWNTGAR